MQNSSTTLSMLSFLLAASCSRTFPDTSDPEPAAESARAAAPSEGDTSDDEIFGVLDAINEEAIMHGEFMKKRAKTRRIKEFAAMMVHVHGDVRDRQREVRSALDLRTSDGRAASDLREDSRRKLQTMEKIGEGSAHDEAYVDIAVDVYKGWLDILDHQVSSGAATAELREELEEVRKLVESHYTLALDLRDQLARSTK